MKIENIKQMDFDEWESDMPELTKQIILYLCRCIISAEPKIVKYVWNDFTICPYCLCSTSGEASKMSEIKHEKNCVYEVALVVKNGLTKK